MRRLWIPTKKKNENHKRFICYENYTIRYIYKSFARSTKLTIIPLVSLVWWRNLTFKLMAALSSCRGLIIILFVILSMAIYDVSGYHLKDCDNRCGAQPWHIAGRCDRRTGRCFCYYGWTGPNSEFRAGTRNEIAADHCTEACHYTHDYK